MVYPVAGNRGSPAGATSFQQEREPFMSMFRNLFGRQDESSAAVIKFGLFALVLLVIAVGAIAFTTYEAVHDNYAIEAGTQYAGKNGWDEPKG
jgi:hypothetical protein